MTVGYHDITIFEPEDTEVSCSGCFKAVHTLGFGCMFHLIQSNLISATGTTYMQ